MRYSVSPGSNSFDGLLRLNRFGWDSAMTAIMFDASHTKAEGNYADAIQYERKGEKNMANATYEVQASQFNIDRTHPGRWTITFTNPPINMFVPTTIVELERS